MSFPNKPLINIISFIWKSWLYGHNDDVIMGAMASQITSLTIVYSTVYSRRRSKLRVTGLCVGYSLVTGEFPTQRASYAEIVSIWWRHHGQKAISRSLGDETTHSEVDVNNTHPPILNPPVTCSSTSPGKPICRYIKSVKFTMKQMTRRQGCRVSEQIKYYTLQYIKQISKDFFASGGL